MTTIIRATDQDRGIQSVAFNFDDMTAKANRYLDKVRGEAAAIVSKARQDAVAVRKQAEEEGRKAGMQSVEQIIQKQLSTALPALKQAIQQIHDAKQAWQRHWEATAVHVAAAIAKRIIRRELSKDPEITLTLVREALQLASGSSQLRVHLNPADYEALGGQVDMLVQEFSSLSSAELVADDKITPGGCRVETKFGIIDKQFESQLKRIEEELT